MTILIDARPLLSGNRSGVPQYAACLTQALLDDTAGKSDRRYSIWANAWQRPTPPEFVSWANQADVIATHYPNRLLNWSFRYLKCPQLETIVSGTDAIWLPNIDFLATRRPFAVTFHDLSFERFPEFFSAKYRAWHHLVGPRQLAHRAAHVFAVSEHTKLDLMDLYGIAADKISVCHPAASGDFSNVTPSEADRVRAKYNLPARFILNVATLEPRKNHTTLISAFEKLPPDTHLVLAGGRGWLYHDILNAIRRSPAAARIRLLDYVPQSDKPGLLAAATVFAFPSYFEGFGMPPLEAMAAGTPVVASRTSSLGEVVGSAGLLINPNDASELAAAIHAIWSDENLAANLSVAGREQAKIFKWTSSAKVMTRALRSIS